MKLPIEDTLVLGVQIIDDTIKIKLLVQKYK